MSQVETGTNGGVLASRDTALRDTAQVLGWLEAAFAWCLAAGETAKAAALYPVISELTLERDTLLLEMLQAQQEFDAANVMASVGR